LNRVVLEEFGIGIKEEFTIPLNMGFLRRFFSKQKESTEVNESEVIEEKIQSKLKEQYRRDIGEDVSSIESILGDEEDKPEEVNVLPAPDYDEHDAIADDVLLDSDMESYTEKNTVEHTSIEELGNHLESATVLGDVSTEVSFDSPE
jgi:hypothetical protein